MAVSPEGDSDREFFTSLGMLIIQGRKWDALRGVRGRGLHCPTVRNSSPPHHQCSLNNLECQTALSFHRTIESIWLRGGIVTIEVILLPECGHTESALLLERWILKSTDENSKMNELSLMQAIDSMIHFSQLSSWWSSTNGTQPINVNYNVYELGDSQNNALEFCDSTTEHRFATCNGVNVHLKSLARQLMIPNLHCESCAIATRRVDSLIYQNRGRSLLQKRSGSRQSSASSGSLSPSAASLDSKSPLGSPLLPLRMTLSSSSSRESSRDTSPCIPQTSQDVDEQSDVAMDTTSRGQNIDQDEELANQLDSLSDSDLSDDYVIDGPIGSPGFVGTPIASPDDSRVQMLQSTFAGFHCRHPAFDRLMGDSFENTETRTRHSSLDSAVSNLERLGLEARRKLNRTNSDGNKFEKLKEGRKNSAAQDFFIRDRKKRHKPAFQSDSCGMHESSRGFSESYETYYASFQTNSDPPLGCGSPVMDFFEASDPYKPQFNYDYGSLVPPPNELSTVGFLTVQYPDNVPRQISPICDDNMKDFVNYPRVNNFEHFTSEKVLLNQLSNYSLMQHNDSSHLSYDCENLDETPVSMSVMQKFDVERVSQELHKDDCELKNSVKQPAKKRDGSPNATAKEMNIQQRRKGPDEDLKLNLQQLSDGEGYENACSSTSSLLRSPPSKLRVLPSCRVEENYEHNPRREFVHKPSHKAIGAPARKLLFNPPQEKATCTSPAPIRRNNSVRFEFDEDMAKLNRRSSRSVCRGKCMKRNGIIAHNHNHSVQTRRLLGSFEESIIHDRLEVLGTVDGFQAQLMATGAFSPTVVKLPVSVCFFHVSDDNAPSPYMGTVSLKGKECAKRGYHIPRKGTILLTLFNPNNSIVKVFAILYDVSDMPPGHRTFLRHRIFSRPVNECGNTSADLGVDDHCEDREDWSQQNQPRPKLLRYFVHLWLESSRTNKIYIHGNIKILFSLASNEWDSGNTFELQTETEFPKKPRYSSKR